MAVPVDVHILYNGQEVELPKTISDMLTRRRYSVFFWEQSVKAGEDVFTIELEQLALSVHVLICLGIKGWGPTQERLAREAVRMDKHIIPILIGKPAETELQKVDELFFKRKWLDLTEFSEIKFQELVDAIGLPGITDYSQFDRFVQILVDGNEEQRAEVLETAIQMPPATKKRFAARLYEEITSRFSISTERRLENAVRDPNKIPSIRSWMMSVLIWTDAEDRAYRDLIFRHLTAAYEPDDGVRYWSLAGLYQVGVSYLSDAAGTCRKDEDQSIALLAEAIMSQNSERLTGRFISLLRGENKEQIEPWIVLRVLRIIAVPGVAKEIVRIIIEADSSNKVLYDAFYAMTNPSISQEAVILLSERLSPRQIFERLFPILAASNYNTLKNYCRFIIYLPAKEVSDTLAGLAGNPTYINIAEGIRTELSRMAASGQSAFNRLPFDSDTFEKQQDWIDIKDDVKQMTAVMMAREVTPPLAIGLFGSWGSGKSFFMHCMRKQVQTIADDRGPRKDFYHNNVVQIEFNAWHYMDSNLWASLMDHILERLKDRLSPVLTAETEQIQLQAELDTRKKTNELAAEKLRLDTDELARKEQALATLENERKDKAVKFSELTMEDAKKILEPEQLKELEESLDKMGLPKVIESVKQGKELFNKFKDLGSRIKALVEFYSGSKNSGMALILTLLVLLVLPAAYFIFKDRITSAIGNIQSVIATLVADFLVFVATAKWVLNRMKKAVEKIEQTKTRIEDVLKSKREAPGEVEILLKKDIEVLQKNSLTASQELVSNAQSITHLETRIQTLVIANSLTGFVNERVSSGDYLKQLGIYSKIRKDFNRMVEILSKPVSDLEGEQNRIDRIILYIDDLDRCPEDKVMEVLKAVHLLLAYPLFVVVVGVDPVWVRKSVASSYMVIGRNNEMIRWEDDNGDEENTPQQFVEKIFQMPFHLRPMTEQGFGRMIEGLFKPVGKDGQPPSQPQTASLASSHTARTDQSDGIVDADPDSSPAANQPETTPATTRQTLDGAVPGNPDSLTGNASQQNKSTSDEPDEKALVLTKTESDFASDFLTFIASPRSAKRFTNMYRFLKAGVEASQLAEFEGTELKPGTFQLPMLLLAMIVGKPNVAAQFLPAYYQQAKTANLIAEVFATDPLDSHPPKDADKVKAFVQQFATRHWFPTDPALITEWLPKVCRFCFEPIRLS